MFGCYVLAVKGSIPRDKVNYFFAACLELEEAKLTIIEKHWFRQKLGCAPIGEVGLVLKNFSVQEYDQINLIAEFKFVVY